MDFSGDVVPADAIVIVGGDTAKSSGDDTMPGEAGEFGQQLLGDFANALGGTSTTVLSVREIDQWRAPELEEATFVEAVETEAGRIRTVLSVAAPDEKEQES